VVGWSSWGSIDGASAVLRHCAVERWWWTGAEEEGKERKWVGVDTRGGLHNDDGSGLRRGPAGLGRPTVEFLIVT
jgi:hypothetical protein